MVEQDNNTLYPGDNLGVLRERRRAAAGVFQFLPLE